MRFAFLLALAAAAFSQSTASSGAVSGTVLDLIGEPVADAPIQAVNTATKAVFNAKSTGKGAYSLAALPAGTYSIVVNAPGFNPYAEPNVTVAAGKTTRFDIHLVDFQFNTLGDGRDIRAALLVEHPTPKGPAPRTADGKPDLSGMWHPLRVTDPGKPELLPWAAALLKQRTEENTKDSPMSQCLPRGAALMGGLYPFKIVQLPGEIVLLFEDWVPDHREIFMDGRPHPKDLYTWMGHATGKWESSAQPGRGVVRGQEADTLVVDRVGFNDASWLDNSGRAHTSQLHIVERYHRTDFGHLEVQMDFDDPGAFARPWSLKGVFDNAGDPREVEIQEFICNENNRDTGHMVGK